MISKVIFAVLIQAGLLHYYVAHASEGLAAFSQLKGKKLLLLKSIVFHTEPNQFETVFHDTKGSYHAINREIVVEKGGKFVRKVQWVPITTNELRNYRVSQVMAEVIRVLRADWFETQAVLEIEDLQGRKTRLRFVFSDPDSFWMLFHSALGKPPANAIPSTSASLPFDPSWSQQPASFMGIKWNASMFDARDEIPLLECDGTERCTGNVNLGRVHIALSLTFEKDQFKQASFTFESFYFETLKAAFMEKYGKPTITKVEDVQNRMGAKFVNETISWQGRSVNIRLDKYGSKLDQGYAFVGLSNYLKKGLNKLSEVVKEAADDL